MRNEEWAKLTKVVPPAPSLAILRQKKVDQNIVGKRLNFCFTEM